MMHSKKGSFVGFILHPVFETVVGILVLIVLMTYISGLASKTGFEKRFLATDIALLMDTIPAMPQQGNLFLLYHPQRAPEFGVSYGFSFFSSRIEVNTGKTDLKPETAYFTPDPTISLKETVIPASDVMAFPEFFKQGNALLIDDVNSSRVQYIPEVLTCSGPKTTKRFSLSGTTPEAQAVATSAQTILGQGTEGTLVVRIRNATTTMVKAYVLGYNDLQLLSQSQRIGCEIVNALTTTLEKQGIDVVGAAVIPINPLQTSTTEDDILMQGNIGVLIEIDLPVIPTDLEQQRKLGFALAQGVSNAQS